MDAGERAEAHGDAIEKVWTRYSGLNNLFLDFLYCLKLQTYRMATAMRTGIET